MARRLALPLLGGILFISYLIYLLFNNQVPADVGDGLEHFRIARDSWNDPHLFLDHWGKPLVTLFSSPFAQGGYRWYIGFNILVVASSLFFAAKIFAKLGVSTWYNWIFALALSSNYEWMHSVLGGLTEPFFGLLLLVIFWAFITEKYVIAALVAGLTLFARSEGMLIVVAVAFLLLIYKQYKKLPFLVVPFILYGFLGVFLGEDFLWYFTNNPYGHGSYGHGELTWYLDAIVFWFSPVMLYLVPIAFFGALMVRNRKLYLRERWVFIVFLLIFVGIVAAHSIFWYTGTLSSAGLYRLATLGLPSGIVVLLILCDVVSRELSAIPKIAALMLISFYSIGLNVRFGQPLQSNALEKILIQSGKYAEMQNVPVYYHHPLIQWASSRKLIKYYFNPESTKQMVNGSLIIRDPQMGLLEMRMPADAEKQYDFLKLEKVIKATEPYHVYTNEPVEIKIYRVVH